MGKRKKGKKRNGFLMGQSFITNFFFFVKKKSVDVCVVFF